MSLVKLAIASSLIFANLAIGVRFPTPHTLVRRQDVPDSCSTTCAAFLAVVDGCPTDACICQGADLRDVQDCLNCILADDPTQTAAVREYAATYGETCSVTVSLSAAPSGTASDSDAPLPSSAATTPTPRPSVPSITSDFFPSQTESESASPTESESETESETPSTSVTVPTTTSRPAAGTTSTPRTSATPATTSSAGGSGGGLGGDGPGGLGSGAVVRGVPVGAAVVAVLAGAMGAVLL